MTARASLAAVAEPSQSGGVIGPNSVIQLAAALRAHGDSLAERVFGAAGFLPLLDAPPDAMTDERIPAALFRALWRDLPEEQAGRIAEDAGRRTAAYVIAHRIPGPARAMLRILPGALAAPLLLRAIEKNAWTFAGSGACTTRKTRPYLIEIKANPLAMPECRWHRAVFRHLFEGLTRTRLTIEHPTCCHRGHETCRFILTPG